MDNAQERLEEQRVQDIVHEYEAEGYEVRAYPPPNELPDFLAGYSPDILARGPHETVVIEVKSKAALAQASYLPALVQALQAHEGWRFELVVANPYEEPLSEDDAQSLSRDEIVGDLKELKDLVHSNHREAALLFAWSTAEATLRLLAAGEEIPLRHRDPTYLLKQLAMYAVISRTDYYFLTQALKVRNAVAHGFKTDELDTTLVSKLIDTVNRLQEAIPDASFA
jgi:hypothetical protein